TTAPARSRTRTTASSWGRCACAWRRRCGPWSRTRSRPRSVSMPRAKCTTCGATLPKNSKFCPECGAAVASGDTVVQEVPATETGPTTVEEQGSPRHIIGAPPSSVLLVLAIVGLIVAIVLFATGYWPWALIALGLALFLFTGFASQARRLPD